MLMDYQRKCNKLQKDSKLFAIKRKRKLVLLLHKLVGNLLRMEERNGTRN